MHMRKLKQSDLPLLVKYANNEKIANEIINIPHPYREPDAAFRLSYVNRGFVDKTRFVFAIILLDIQEFVGEISLHYHQNKSAAELGYWIAEPFWNKGLASEAIDSVIRFGFEQLDLDRIYASCGVENEPSSRVLIKNGLTKIAEVGNMEHYEIYKNIKLSTTEQQKK